MDEHGLSWMIMIFIDSHGWTWNKWMEMEGYGRTRIVMDIYGWSWIFTDGQGMLWRVK
jgi:hypothetical protein